jgi:hypothetical protein
MKQLGVDEAYLFNIATVVNDCATTCRGRLFRESLAVQPAAQLVNQTLEARTLRKSVFLYSNPRDHESRTEMPLI